jgi:hypothetical protein
VVSASNDVMALSIRNLAPTALVRQHYAHALEGFVVSVPWSQAQAVADELARNPAVDAVELDRALAIEQASTARTLDARAWGVDRLDQRARVFDNLFRHTRTGQGVTAYVVDTGVSAHNQFGTRLRAGFSTVNDGQGTRDCHGHGTHVARPWAWPRAPASCRCACSIAAAAAPAPACWPAWTGSPPTAPAPPS